MAGLKEVSDLCEMEMDEIRSEMLGFPPAECRSTTIATAYSQAPRRRIVLVPSNWRYDRAIYFIRWILLRLEGVIDFSWTLETHARITLIPFPLVWP